MSNEDEADEIVEYVKVMRPTLDFRMENLLDHWRQYSPALVDELRAYPTWTFMASKAQGQFDAILGKWKTTRYVYMSHETGSPIRLADSHFLEALTPREYDDVLRTAQACLRSDAKKGLPVPPLNERAHVPTLALDVDEGDFSLAEMIALGRLIQNVASVHCNTPTSFVLAARQAVHDGKRAWKYHMYFPEILLVDIQCWALIRELVFPHMHMFSRRIKIDTMPMFNRCLRLHGTDRSEGPCAGAGVYLVLAKYGADNVSQTASDANTLVSIRPGSHVVHALLSARGQSMIPRAVTTMAASMADKITTNRPAEPGEGVPRVWLQPMFSVAASTTSQHDDSSSSSDSMHSDPDIEIILIDRAPAPKWVLATVSQTECNLCGQHGEQTVLARLGSTKDGVNVAYRWCFCHECPDSVARVVSWPPVVLPVHTVDENVDRVAADYVFVDPASPPPMPVNAANMSTILDVPLESFYAPGLRQPPLGASVEFADLEQFRLADRRVDSDLSNYPFDMLTVAMARHAADQAAITEKLRDSVRCVRETVTTDEARYVGERLHVHANPGEHMLVTLAAPCGTGKTVAAFDIAFGGLAKGDKVLIVAPYTPLTHELAKRAADTSMGQTLRRVVHYDSPLPDDDAYDAVVVTPESVYKFRNMRAKRVIVDEFCSVLKTLYTSETAAGRRNEIWATLVAAMTFAERVVVMDKDIGPQERLWLAALVCYTRTPGLRWPLARAGHVLDLIADRPGLVVHEFELRDRIERQVDLWTNATAMRRNILTDVAQGSCVAVFMANRNEAHELQAWIGVLDPEISVLMINGHTNADDKRTFSRAPDSTLDDNGTQVWIYTTSAAFGISVEEHKFDVVYVFAGPHLTQRVALQAAERVRHISGQARGTRQFHLCVPFDRSMCGLSRMPTLGTALLGAQMRVHYSAEARACLTTEPTYDSNLTQTMGDDYWTIVACAIEQTERLENEWQAAVWANWQLDCNARVVYHHIEDEEIEHGVDKSVKQAERKVKKRVRELARVSSQRDLVVKEYESNVVKRRKQAVAEKYCPAAWQRFAAENAEFMSYVNRKRHEATMKTWYEAWLAHKGRIVAEDAKAAKKAMQEDGVTHMATAKVAPAFFTLCVLKVVGAQGVLDGEPWPATFEYNAHAKVTSPFIHRPGEITGATFFELLHANTVRAWNDNYRNFTRWKQSEDASELLWCTKYIKTMMGYKCKCERSRWCAAAYIAYKEGTSVSDDIADLNPFGIKGDGATDPLEDD